MIDYIKYTVDGKTYSLIDNGDGTWLKEATAPSVAGNYSLTIQISENGQVTFIDASDSNYSLYLDVIVSTEKVVFLQNYLPNFMKDITEINEISATENLEFDKILAGLKEIESNLFIETGSNDAITRIENYIKIKGQGTLEQRKSFILSLYQKGKKLNETAIKNITNAIAGANCIVTFFGSDEVDNPYHGYGALRIRVLSPDTSKDYRYEDILRTLRPLVPTHLKLIVIKYFALWDDVKNNFADWSAVASMSNWQTVKDYIPPE